MTHHDSAFPAVWGGNQSDWFWQNQAACRDVPEFIRDEFTYVPAGRGVAHEQTKRLKREYCDHCPVLAQCREWADRDVYFAGIAGGRLYRDIRNGRGTRGGIVEVEDEKEKEDG